MNIRLVTLTTLASLTFSAPSQANQLDSMEIKEKLTGKKVYLSTKWGIEFPLTYASDGKVTGDGSGTGLGQYFAPKETGKWWVKDDQMCQQFPTWYDGRTFCFSLEATGTKTLIWKRDDGRSGKARLG